MSQNLPLPVTPSAESIVPDTIYVTTLADLPTPVNRVITLVSDTTYYFTTVVDLETCRLVCSSNNTLLGYSANNSGVTSTLGSGEALITSSRTIPIRDLRLSAVGSGAEVFDLDATGNPLQAVDWHGLFIFDGVIGTITNFAYINVTDLTVVACDDGVTFDGTIQNISFTQSIFSGGANNTTYIWVKSTCTITNWITCTLCTFDVPATCSGVKVSTLATISASSYILNTCSFTGAGTYLNDVTSTSNKAVFRNCLGIANSSSLGQLYMIGNVSSTTISNTTDFYAITGTFSANAINQKFTQNSDKLVYSGATTQLFSINAILSLTSGNNNVIHVKFYLNDAALNESVQYATTSGSGRAENVTIGTFVSLSQSGNINVRIRNTTGSNNITVENCIINVHAI